MANLPTVLIILAAGSSSRLGKPKQLLAIENTNLLSYIIKKAENSKADKVVCVLGANSDLIKENLSLKRTEIIVNPKWEQGISTSITKSISELQISYKNKFRALFILADQPAITSTYLDEMMLISDNKGPEYIVATRYNSGGGVPAIFPPKYFEDLLNLKGDQGAKRVINENSDHLISLENEALKFDIDTLENYENYINRNL